MHNAYACVCKLLVYSFVCILIVSSMRIVLLGFYICACASVLAGHAHSTCDVEWFAVGKVTSGTARFVVQLSIAEELHACVRTWNDIVAIDEDAVNTPPTSVPMDASTRSAARFLESRIPRRLLEGLPTSLAVGDLTPNTRYTVRFRVACDRAAAEVAAPVPCVTQFAASRFRTFPGGGITLDSASGISIGAVSCNDRSATQLTPGRTEAYESMWGALWRRVEKGDVDLLLHTGDHVYLDHAQDRESAGAKSAVEVARQLLGGASVSSSGAWDVYRNEIVHMFRREYVAAYQQPYVADVLANVPNMMQMDDHEIMDDIGETHATFSSVDQFVAQLAYVVYTEYEVQLTRDVEWEASALSSASRRATDKSVLAAAGVLPFHAHAWGDVGMLFVETRASRTLFRQENVDGGNDRQQTSSGGGVNISDGVIVPVQKEFIEASVCVHSHRRGGCDAVNFSAARLLVVVVPQPVVFISRALGDFGKMVVDDWGGYFGSSPSDQVWFLDILSSWQAQSGDRRVVLVSGDLHLSLASVVWSPQRLHHHPGIVQFVSSGISMQELPSVVPRLICAKGATAIEAPEQHPGEKFLFTHANCSSRSNFLLLHAAASPVASETCTHPQCRPRVIGEIVLRDAPTVFVDVDAHAAIPLDAAARLLASAAPTATPARDAFRVLCYHMFVLMCALRI